MMMAPSKTKLWMANKVTSWIHESQLWLYESRSPSYSYSFDTMIFFMHWIINANLNIARWVDKLCADSDICQVCNLCGCPIQALFQAFS